MDNGDVYRSGVQRSHGKEIDSGKFGEQNFMNRTGWRQVALALAAVTLALLWSAGMDAQERGDATRATAKAAAPIDLTGYWVSVVTQDWRWRMVTPAKGDYESIPITVE